MMSLMARRLLGRTYGPLSAALVLALAVHAAAVGCLVWCSPHEQPVASASGPVPLFDVVLDEGPTPVPPPDVAFEPNDGPPGLAAPPARPRQTTRVAEAPPQGAPAPASQAPPTTSAAGFEAAASSPASTVGPEATTPRNFSLGPLPPSFARGGQEVLPGPRAAPDASTATSDALRDAIAQGEQARGLTASGPIVAAARVAAGAMTAPAEGSTTLSINVGADGSVNSVTANHDAWKTTANALRSALAGRRLRVPTGAAGVSVELRVDARVTNAPPLLTGEDKVKPCSQGRGRLAWGGSPDTTPAPTGCIDVLSLMPLRRRQVSVALLRETPL